MFRKIGINVFDASIERVKKLYSEGHRLVVSTSGGKDSTVCLEVCRIAAKETGRLPVEAVMRDEEIMPPGTFEYLERIYKDKEISLNWLIAGQPIINSFSRDNPYWWVFDKTQKDKWVRQPPKYAQWINGKNIDTMTIPKRFAVKKNKNLYAIIGLRMSESRNRMMGMLSSGDYITKKNKEGVYNVRPVYDWTDDDVWKAIYDNRWDYNSYYDVMCKMGARKSMLRVAPPTMYQGIDNLNRLMCAFPKWFDKMANRIDGIRTAAQFGSRAIRPIKRINENWEQCSKRIFTKVYSPEWIIKRFETSKSMVLNMHGRHSSQQFPDDKPCKKCPPHLGSWKRMVDKMYMGDPFSQFNTSLAYMEPEFFRKGAGTWGGKPAW